MGEIQIDQVAVNMYEAASRANQAEGLRNYLGMSEIGGVCEKRLWYSFRQYTPSTIDGRLQMVFSLGNAVEAEVLKWLQQAGYRIEGQQTEFSAVNGFFKGHCDGIIHGITKRPHILEIKSASASRFNAFKSHGIANICPEYAAQVQSYMGYAGLERAIFVVMCKNTCEIYTERFHFDKEYFQVLETRAEIIINTNNVVTLQGSIPNGYECNYCRYRGHCQDTQYIQLHKTCGSCWYCNFYGSSPVCNYHKKEIKKWGQGCPDWVFAQETDEVPF